jgi:hypothetical protein
MTNRSSKKLEVYLDSSDFSNLSNPKTVTPALTTLLEQLKNFSYEGHVNFRFSAVHVCEVAPVEPVANIAADMRAELIWQLCGHNSMIDYMRLMEAEIKAETISAFSDIGQWHPNIGTLLPENIDALHRKSVNEMLLEEDLNREQRRKLKKSILNKNGFTVEVSKWFDSNIEDTARSLIQAFPFTEEESRLAISFFRTGKHRLDTYRALLRVLSDPRWLIKKLSSSPTELQAITGWLRIGGENAVKTISESIGQMQRLRSDIAKSDAEFRSAVKNLADVELRNQLTSQQNSQKQRRANDNAKLWQDFFVSNVNTFTEKLATEFSLQHSKVLDGKQAFEMYPGISTFTSAIHHAWRNATEIRPRQLMASDIGDAWHSVYAPYVDIFRADAFMTAPIHNAVKRYGTLVVGSLRDLPDAISDSINSKNLTA